MEFQVGKTFESFKAFSEQLKIFCESNNSLFVRRTSVKIKDPNLAHLEFEAAGYVCKQGKANHSSKSTGTRPNQKSFKIGCTASFRLSCVRPQNGGAPHLKISKADFTHNGHETTSHVFRLYPEQRRFNADEVDRTVLSAATMKTSEKKATLENRHDGVLMRQDVYNLQRKLDVGNGGRGRDEEKCVRMVRKRAVPSKFQFPPDEETESDNGVLMSVPSHQEDKRSLPSTQVMMDTRVPGLYQPQPTPVLMGNTTPIVSQPQSQTYTTGGNAPIQPKPVYSNDIILGGMDSNGTLCNNVDCDKEKKWLTHDLQYSLLEEGRLKERMQYLRNLANIDLKMLRVCLVTGDKAKAELEKVFRLVKYILDDEEKKEVQIKMEITEEEGCDHNNPDKRSLSPQQLHRPSSQKVKRSRASNANQPMATVIS